jgi:hypothetical protein
MKTKLIIVILLLPFFVLGNRNIKKENKKKEKTQKEEPPKKRRYRLDDKTNNYFNLGANRIIIQVPVTSKKLRMTNYVKNVSSDEINAVLVWIKSRDIDSTPCTGDFSNRTRKIRMSKLKGLKEQLQNSNDNKLLVLFFIDDEEPDYRKENYFRKMVREANSYEEAVNKVNQGNCNQENSFYKDLEDYFKPAESGGDVIGGNG